MNLVQTGTEDGITLPSPRHCTTFTSSGLIPASQVTQRGLLKFCRVSIEKHSIWVVKKFPALREAAESLLYSQKSVIGIFLEQV
jgi:hypothetical protein